MKPQEESKYCVKVAVIVAQEDSRSVTVETEQMTVTTGVPADAEAVAHATLVAIQTGITAMRKFYLPDAKSREVVS